MKLTVVRATGGLLGTIARSKVVGKSSCLMAALLASVGCGGGATSQELDRPGLEPDGLCTVGQPQRQQLALPGMAGLYVEPNAFVEGADGRVLLAGSPIYAFAFDSAGLPELVEDPEIFGVLIQPDGSVQPVPKPLDGHLSTPRANALPGGGWEIVFAVDSTGLLSQVGYHLGARYGRYDGTRWSVLEDPFAAAETSRYRYSSQLVRTSSGLWWLVGSPPGSRFTTSPTLLSRDGGEWEAVSVPFGGDAYVELAASPSDEALHALVVRADTLESSDENSVFLHRQADSGWVEIAKLADGGDEPAHFPVFGFHGSNVAAGWVVFVPEDKGVRKEARASMTVEDVGSQHVLDGNISYMRFEEYKGTTLWVVDHSPPGGAAELRVVQLRDGKSQVRRALPSPFTGPFSVAVSRAGELLVVGPELDPHAGMLSNVVLRFPVQCGAAS